MLQTEEVALKASVLERLRMLARLVNAGNKTERQLLEAGAIFRVVRGGPEGLEERGMPLMVKARVRFRIIRLIFMLVLAAAAAEPGAFASTP